VPSAQNPLGGSVHPAYLQYFITGSLLEELEFELGALVDPLSNIDTMNSRTKVTAAIVAYI
jgi:hypothetical protein